MAKEKETKQEEITAQEATLEAAEAVAETVTTPAKAKNKSKAAKQESEAAAQKGTYIYVGPTLPDGSLRKNQTLRGTHEEVLAYLAPQTQKYPQVKRLIVSVSGLAQEKRKIEAGGNAAGQAYSVLNAATTTKEEN